MEVRTRKTVLVVNDVLAEMKIQVRQAEGLMNRYIEVLEQLQEEGKTVATEEERMELFAITITGC